MRYSVYDVCLANTEGRLAAVKNAIRTLNEFKGVPGVTDAQVIRGMEAYLEEIKNVLEIQVEQDTKTAKTFNKQLQNID